MSPIGLAVIGAGYWGPNLVRTALSTPALRLEWLCDSTSNGPGSLSVRTRPYGPLTPTKRSLPTRESRRSP